MYLLGAGTRGSRRSIALGSLGVRGEGRVRGAAGGGLLYRRGRSGAMCHSIAACCFIDEASGQVATGFPILDYKVRLKRL